MPVIRLNKTQDYQNSKNYAEHAMSIVAENLLKSKSEGKNQSEALNLSKGNQASWMVAMEEKAKKSIFEQSKGLRTDVYRNGLKDEERLTLSGNHMLQTMIKKQSEVMQLSDNYQQNLASTTIGQISTEFDTELYQMPMSMIQDDPLLSRVTAKYADAQTYIYQYQSALVGMMSQSTRLAASGAVDAPAFGFQSVNAGYWGNQIEIDVSRMEWYRNPHSISGNQTEYATARAFAQLAVLANQRMHHIAYRTRVDNGYSYMYKPYSEAPEAIGFMAYGRLPTETYDFDEPAMIRNLDGTFTDNPNSLQLQGLMKLVTQQQNANIINMRTFLEGFMLSPETYQFMTLQAINQNNASSALGFATAVAQNFDTERLYNLVPQLANLKLVIVEGHLNKELSEFGTIAGDNAIEYYMENGYMLPLFDFYNGASLNGEFLFMPNERTRWLSNMQDVPSNMCPLSDPRAFGFRVISSLETHDNTPMLSMEVTGRFAFFNRFSAVDFLVKTFKDAA